MKCTLYWPNADSQTYANITVTFKSAVTHADFVIRTFDVKSVSQNSPPDLIFLYSENEVRDCLLSLPPFFSLCILPLRPLFQLSHPLSLCRVIRMKFVRSVSFTTCRGPTLVSLVMPLHCFTSCTTLEMLTTTATHGLC